MILAEPGRPGAARMRITAPDGSIVFDSIGPDLTSPANPMVSGQIQVRAG